MKLNKYIAQIPSFIQVVDSELRCAVERKSKCSAGDLVQAVLSIEFVASEALQICLSHILNGNICGKEASLCISILSSKILTLTTLPFTPLELTRVIGIIESISESCLQSLADSIDEGTDSPECLELLSPSADCLALLARRLPSAMRKQRGSETLIVDRILEMDWGHRPSLFAHLLCDIYQHMPGASRDTLKVIECFNYINYILSTFIAQKKILRSVVAIPKDEYAALLGVCLRLFELRCVFFKC